MVEKQRIVVGLLINSQQDNHLEPFQRPKTVESHDDRKITRHGVYAIRTSFPQEASPSRKSSSIQLNSLSDRKRDPWNQYGILLLVLGLGSLAVVKGLKS
ncbi:hypothetical protein A9Q99_22565 [Gammaproteobacteria bacterium 45_16_T64]|nr:hypothetical protein A9Q99_22565 [Gammaproteobacteria bacterium 45_16_T64]